MRMIWRSKHYYSGAYNDIVEGVTGLSDEQAEFARENRERREANANGNGVWLGLRGA